MELDELLKVMDAVQVNLEKAEKVWERAEPLLPSSFSDFNVAGTEYSRLEYTWTDLISALPPIEGWTITEPLPDPEDVVRDLIDYSEIGEIPWSVWKVRSQPGEDLARYRDALGRARRNATHSRLTTLADAIDKSVAQIVAGVPRDSPDVISNDQTTAVEEHFGEIERLLGESRRTGRWGDLYRHMSFSQGHDWWDVVEFDWPSIKPVVLSAVLSEADPVPTPTGIDLALAASDASGPVSSALAWEKLAPDDFERLLFDLLNGLDGYDNVQWLMATRAPDRGRDLSCDRRLVDGSGAVRTERVIVQAKHWLSKSVGPSEIADALSRLPTWEPPHIHAFIVATSGRYTADAQSHAEKHNEKGSDPFIELWADSTLERLLAGRPELVTAFHLRE